MKKILLTLLIFFGVGFSAQIYNLESEKISDKITELNEEYQLNIDIVVLDLNDNCADKSNYMSCVQNNYSDFADIIFGINIHQRHMETLVKTKIEKFIPTYTAKSFEENIVPFMKNENYEGAIINYLDQIENYLTQLCTDYNLTGNCNISNLKIGYTKYIQTQKELELKKELERQIKKRKSIITTFLVLLGIFLLVILLVFIFRVLKRNRTRKQVVLLLENATFFQMDIDNSPLYPKEKTKLHNKIQEYIKSLEYLLSNNLRQLHKKFYKNKKYIIEIDEIIKEYEKYLDILSQVPDIEDNLEKIKKINL